MHLRPLLVSNAAVLFLLLGTLTFGCAAPEIEDEESGSTESAIGATPVGTPPRVTVDLNHRAAPSTSAEILQVIPEGTVVRSGSAHARAGWIGVTWNGRTGWVDGQYVERAGDTPSDPTGGAISARGQTQMRAIVSYATSHHAGASRGRCFEYVWRYLTSSGYGLLNDHGDAADMGSAYARNFAEYMNAASNAELWGLRRLAIDNPHDAPAGAVVVVAAGSPGTSHPTAGDIAIAAGGGRLINDGPNMTYGSRATFKAAGGRLLGAYVPR